MRKSSNLSCVQETTTCDENFTTIYIEKPVTIDVFGFCVQFSIYLCKCKTVMESLQTNPHYPVHCFTDSFAQVLRTCHIVEIPSRDSENQLHQSSVAVAMRPLRT